jgi:hypothetical protein
MMTSGRNLYLILIFFIPKLIISQEAIGISMDNYSGVWGGQLNPASLTQNKTYVDINIISGSFHFSNNFAYIPPGDPSFFGPFPIDTLRPIYGEFDYNGYYTYYKNTSDKWISLSTKIMGPSAMFQYNRHAFAFTSSLKTYGSGISFPWEIPVFAYEDLTYEPLQKQRFNDKDFGVNELVWSEFAFSYANEIYKKRNVSISVGITGKLLFGIAAVYNTYKKVDYKVLDEKNILFYNLNSDVAYAYVENIDNIDVSLLSPGNSNGFGLGADIGIVYKKVKKPTNYYDNGKACKFPYEDYLYKIGFSILDIGNIKFSKNAEQHNYYARNTLLNIDSLPDFNDQTTVSEYLRSLSEILTGDPDSSFVDSSFRVNLPTAASLQFDWHIKNPYYLSFLWVQPITFKTKNARRPAQIAVIPRFENRFFGISLPVSLLNYRTFRTGLSIRIYNLTIGTESLGTLLDFRNLDNVDLYFSLKFNLQKGRCDISHKDACYGWK